VVERIAELEETKIETIAQRALAKHPEMGEDGARAWAKQQPVVVTLELIAPNGKPVTVEIIHGMATSTAGSAKRTEKWADVKEILAPVVKLAAELHIAILGLMHLNKATGAKAINRISGSMAFPGLSRCSWVFAKDSREPGRRLMLPVKINIGPDESGIEYSIESDHGVPFIKWGQSCTEDVDSILSGVSPREEGKHAPAQEAVLRVLRDVGGNMKLSGLAQVLGKSTPTISNLLRKLEASGEVQPGAEYGSWRLANSAT